MQVNNAAVLKIHDAAGVARGAIYNNIAEPEALFDEIASKVLHDMHMRVGEGVGQIEDPAQRLACGIQRFIRHVHEDPWWGRFVVRFAANDDTMRRLMDEPPSADIKRGMHTGRFSVAPEALASVLSLVGGSTLTAMQSVLAGRQTWREAGPQIAELILRALGLDAQEAHAISIVEPHSRIAINKPNKRPRS